VEQFVGGPPAKLKARYAQASPITYAGKGAAPTLLVWGTEDELVPYQQSERLGARLREAGARVDLLPLPGARHNLPGEHGERAEAAMLRFFDRHLKAAGQAGR
jgi:dipeptidyl aminopeptidase/acylaminoacyl peptidase